MARLEGREFETPATRMGAPKQITRLLLVLPENEAESKVIDQYLGSGIPTGCIGKVDLSDGCGEHYIELRALRAVEQLTQDGDRGDSVPTRTRTRTRTRTTRLRRTTARQGRGR